MAGNVDPDFAHHRDGFWANAGRLRASRVDLESVAGLVPKKTFCHLTSCRIACAEIPFAVGAYITGAYWFTSSTSFANPAVTLARSMTNRKGRLPHTVVLTAEPFPPRLASLALGTGDLDCVYHFALPELLNAVAGNEVAENLVRVMVEGKRLKDISDLPLDLAV
jgi:hypothetical protein